MKAHREWKMVLTIESGPMNDRRIHKRTASFNAGYDSAFSEMIKFMDDAKKIWRYAMKAKAKNNWYQLEVTEYTYDGENSDLNRWVSRYEPGDEEGIYLDADTKYTPAERDMYLTKDLMNDLAFTLR